LCRTKNLISTCCFPKRDALHRSFSHYPHRWTFF